MFMLGFSKQNIFFLPSPLASGGNAKCQIGLLFAS